jgi:hypothetical protein
MLKIMAPVVKHSAYRQRVYQRPDGVIELVIGDADQDPTWNLLADHDVDQVSTITDHVEPTPAPTPDPTPAPAA